MDQSIKLVSSEDGGSDLVLRSHQINDVELCKLGSSEIINSPSREVNLSHANLSEAELETLVKIVEQRASGKQIEMLAKEFGASVVQRVGDKSGGAPTINVPLLNSREGMDGSFPQTIVPIPQLTPESFLTPVGRNPRWSDLAEVGVRSKLSDLPDSLKVTKDRGSHHSITVATKSVTPVSPSAREGLGLSYFGERGATSVGSLEAVGNVKLGNNHQAGISGINGALQNENGLRHDSITREGLNGGNRGGLQGRRGGNRGGHGGGRGNVWVNRNQESRTWANVASAPSRSEVKLHFIPPSCSSDLIVVEMPVPSPLAKWEACLVGYFLGRSLPFNLIKNNAFNVWQKLGLLEVLVNDEGFIFFIFENQDSCIRVIEGGPWYIGGILLILKKWHRMMKLTKEEQGTIPVWVKFYNIPMEFWDSEGLSRIASAIGVPLFIDNLTSFGNRISFARVFVEIKASSLLPNDFQIKYKGETVTIRVEYQGVLVKCEHCGVFGHDTKVSFRPGV